MVFVVLCQGTPKDSTGSGSGFKAFQKTRQWLKVSSDRLGDAGNQTCDPWFTRHRFSMCCYIIYTQNNVNLLRLNNQTGIKIIYFLGCRQLIAM